MQAFDDETLVGIIISSQDKEAEAAFEQLFARYQGKIWNYTYNLSNFDQSMVDDILQLAFLKAWRNIHSLKDHTRFFQWLVTITRNEAYARINIEKKYQQLDDWMHPEKEDPSLSRLEDGQESHQLLQKLSQEEADIVVMKSVLELNFKEISEQTELSLSAAKMKYYRALEKLSSPE